MTNCRAEKAVKEVRSGEVRKEMEIKTKVLKMAKSENETAERNLIEAKDTFENGQDEYFSELSVVGGSLKESIRGQRAELENWKELNRFADYLLAEGINNAEEIVESWINPE